MESSEGYQPPQNEEEKSKEKWIDRAIQTVTRTMLPTSTQLMEIYGEEVPPKDALKTAMAIDAARGSTRLIAALTLYAFPEAAVGSALVMGGSEIAARRVTQNFLQDQIRTHNKVWQENHRKEQDIKQSE